MPSSSTFDRRLSPLHPIFDVRKRTGAIDVGNPAFYNGHAHLTAALAAAGPTYRWDTSVYSGALPPLDGGITLSAAFGTAAYRYAFLPLNTLVGLNFTSDVYFQNVSALTLTDNQPFSVFFLIANTVPLPPLTHNWVIAATNKPGFSSFNHGYMGQLSNNGGTTINGQPYGLVALSAVTRDAAQAPVGMAFPTVFTYLLVYTGTAINMYVNGTLITSVAYSGGVDHNDSGNFRLGATLGNAPAANASPYKGGLGYPAWWQNTALGATEAMDFTLASGALLAA